ncbi:hypothetical protein RYX36_012821, partial [Vicia faba]
WKCDKLPSLPEALNTLSDLQEMEIYNLPNLHSYLIDDLPINLQELTVGSVGSIFKNVYADESCLSSKHKIVPYGQLQWFAFRDYRKSSAADYAKVASEKISRLSSWNSFEREHAMKRKRRFIIVLIQDALREYRTVYEVVGPLVILEKVKVTLTLITDIEPDEHVK